MTDCILLHCRRYCNTSRNDNIPLIKQGNIDANMNGNAYLQNRRICRRNWRNWRNFRMPTLRRRVRGNECFADIRSFFSFHAIRNGIMRPRSSRPCLPCNPRRSTRERRGTAHCACTLRACSNRTACTSAGHRTCAAHANAPFRRRSPRRRPAMNGESSHACRAPRRCFRSDYAAHTGRSRRAAARGTFAHMRCAPTRNAAHLRKRAVRRSCALALLRSCAFTSSPAARFARRRPAFGESAQPRSSGHRYESNRDRAYAYSRTAPR